MKNIYQNINFIQPDETIISRQEYLQQIKKMIIQTIQKEPTVVLHTDEEILEKYNHSIVAIHNSQIVWNANLYPTHMSELQNILHPTRWLLNIGELGSVIVDEHYRHHNIWKYMIFQTIQKLSSPYDAVVSATVNECMTKIFDKHWFVEIPFPKEYFKEWLSHLWPKMPWGIEEFKNKAKCFMLFNTPIKKHVLEVLNHWL